MSSNNFNIHFLNQFHQKSIAYPGKKEKQINKLLFRQFHGKKDELTGLAAVLEQKLDDSKILSRLITQIENQNIPDYFRLSHSARELKRNIAAYVVTEPFTTSYYIRVLGVLKPFIRLIEDFHEKAQQRLLNRLKAANGPEESTRNYTSFRSQEADELSGIFERFLDHQYDYYNDLNSCIDRDADGSKGVTVTT